MKRASLFLLLSFLLLFGCTDFITGKGPSPSPSPAPPGAPNATAIVLPATVSITVPPVESPTPTIVLVSSKIVAEPYLELEDFRAVHEWLSQAYYANASEDLVLDSAATGHRNSYSFNYSFAGPLPYDFYAVPFVSATYLLFSNASEAAAYVDSYAVLLESRPSATFIREPASIPAIASVINNNVSVKDDFSLALFGDRSKAYRRILSSDAIGHYVFFSKNVSFVLVESVVPQGQEIKSFEFDLKLAKLLEQKLAGANITQRDRTVNCNVLLRKSERATCSP